MSKIFLTFITVIFLFNSLLNAQNVTPRQYFFTIKKIFPETQNIDLLIEESQLDDLKNDIAKAAAQAQLKVKIYPVNDTKSIGKSVKKLKNSGTLVVLPSPVINNNSSKMFILSKCKEKDISIVTESKEYSDSGALLGLFPQEGAKTKIVLNLKHSQELLARFTPDYAKQIGISEVIQ